MSEQSEHAGDRTPDEQRGIQDARADFIRSLTFPSSLESHLELFRPTDPHTAQLRIQESLQEAVEADRRRLALPEQFFEVSIHDISEDPWHMKLRRFLWWKCFLRIPWIGRRFYSRKPRWWDRWLPVEHCWRIDEKIFLDAHENIQRIAASSNNSNYLYYDDDLRLALRREIREVLDSPYTDVSEKIYWGRKYRSSLNDPYYTVNANITFTPPAPAIHTTISFGVTEFEND